MRKLLKLQNLCNKANRKYAAGKNDDDEVAAMFAYAKEVRDEARVIIGYDTYHAMSLEAIKEHAKTGETAEGYTNQFNFYSAEFGGTFRTDLP